MGVMVVSMLVMSVVIVTVMGLIVLGAVGTAGATGLGAGAERFGHDLADRPRATPALGTAAKATIDLARGAGHDLVAGYDAAHVVIADDVTGTNDHGENFRLLMTLYG